MKTTALALFVLILPALYGCGSQDRYQVIDPPAYMEILEGEFATITRVPTLHNDDYDGKAVEVDGVLYFYAASGMVYKTTDSGYESLPFIPGYYVREMVAGPGELLWVIDRYARIYTLQNDQWVFEYDIQMESGSVEGIIYDNQGRLLIYGDSSGLWCRETSGEYNLKPSPEYLHIMDGWCDFGQDPVFVDSQWRVYSEGVDGWEFSDSLWDGPPGYYPLIEGNNQGWLAVPILDTKTLQLNVGHGWQEFPYSQTIRYLFWLDDQLYGTDYNEEYLYKWSGTDWEQFLAFPWSTSQHCRHSFPSGSGQRMFFYGGGSLFFNGTSLTIETPVLGHVKGVIAYENSNHVLLANGFHYRDGGGDGVWEEVGQPFPGKQYLNYQKTLMVDDQNQLILLGNNGILIWDGGSSYREVPLNGGLREGFPQSGGEVVLHLHNQFVAVWANDEITTIGPAGSSSSNYHNCHLDDSGQVILATETHLRRLTQDESSIILTFQGWYCKDMIWAEQSGLVCGGNNHLVVVDGSKVSNKTPAWPNEENWIFANPGKLMADWLGGWLAYDYTRDTLLRFDGQQWWAEGDGALSWVSYGVEFLDNLDGTYFLQSDDVVLLIDMEGQ